jgi:hypothetical protein
MSNEQVEALSFMTIDMVLAMEALQQIAALRGMS